MSKNYLDSNGLLYLWGKIKARFADKTETANALANKVDKDGSKVLSTNDYTTAEKNKLAGIATGAEVNVQSDWNQTSTGADDYIKNKPGNATTVLRGFMSPEDKTKLNSMHVVTYGYTNTADSTGTKVVHTEEGGFVPTQGNVIIVRFEFNNTASTFKLNVDGTGALDVYGPAGFTDGDRILSLVGGPGTFPFVVDVNPGNDALIYRLVGTFDTTYELATTSNLGLMSASDKTKLNGIATGAEVNVQSDWNQTSTGADDYIKNKPTIPIGSSTTPLMDGTAAVGTETAFARGDHVHPSDTSRVPTSRTVNGHALTGNVTVTNLDLGNTRGSCSTATNTPTKTVSASGFSLKTGSIVFVYFSNGPGIIGTININNTGAKGWSKQEGSITSSATDPLDTGEKSPCVYGLYYNGTKYILISQTYAVSTTSTPGLLSASDKTKLNRLVFDSNNRISSSILPSYVDDVIEAYPIEGATPLSAGWLSDTYSSVPDIDISTPLSETEVAGDPLTPESGKIYILMWDTEGYTANTQFRWGGSTYVVLSDGSGISAITNTEIDTIVAS